MTHPLTAYRLGYDPPLTRAALARILGVSCSAITRWESNKRKPDGRMLPRIAAVTGIPARELRPDWAEYIERPAP